MNNAKSWALGLLLAASLLGNYLLLGPAQEKAQVEAADAREAAINHELAAVREAIDKVSAEKNAEAKASYDKLSGYVTQLCHYLEVAYGGGTFTDCVDGAPPQ